jgi:endonuclease/exonuclease/phosphatase family metal-dependent hydrolase
MQRRMPPLRLASYNVRYFGHGLRGLAGTRRTQRLIAAAVASMDSPPDILCLQEVESVSLRSRVAHRPTRTPQTQLEAFMEELKEAFLQRSRPFLYEGYYFRAHAYRLGRLPLYTTGLAVILNTRRLRVRGHNAAAPASITHHYLHRWKDTKQTRICAQLQLEDDAGRSFTLFNTHLSLPTPFHRAYWTSRDKMGFGVNQLEEAKTLAAFVRTHARAGPFVVCGDFNSPPVSPVYRYLTEVAALTDVQVALGQVDPSSPRGFPTAGFLRLRMHLDHVFCGGSARWLDLDGTYPLGQRDNPFQGLSDHVPIIGRFEP